MKIALAHYSTREDIGGVTTWLIGFCERLAHTGHQVVMHLNHFGDEPQEASILPILQRLGIEIHAVSNAGSLHADTKLTIQFLNQVQPDLFLPQCLHAHYIAAAHAGRQGLPWIFTMHSDDPDYWCVAEALTPELNGGTSVTVSQFLAKQLQRRVPDTHPSVIPYWINVPAESSRFSNQPFRVVYSGRMVEQQKCISQVVSSLISACKSSNKIEAALIGDGAERSSCEKHVQDAGLSERIHFHGRVPADQVPIHIQRSQAILLMSDFEGLPVALLEAMACGVVPVVRCIPSGIPELVQHEQTGLLVTKDPKKAAAALIRLANDPQLWQRCSENGRALVGTSYNSNQCFASWLELINTIQNHSSIRYPLSTKKIYKSSPFRDPRFQTQYPSKPSQLKRWRPLGILQRIKNRLISI